MREYWLKPIPRYKAFIAVMIPLAGSLVSSTVAIKQMNSDAAKIADANQKLTILHEMTGFMLDRASDRTIAELNDKVEFWRVIREMRNDEDESTE